MRVIMLTSLSVLILTCSVFFVYEIVTFRQTSVRELRTLGHIIAGNSTASLAFDDADAANEILSALKAEPHIQVACLYDTHGNIFTVYPVNFPREELPQTIPPDNYTITNSYLDGFQTITQGEKKLGTLYLRSDMEMIYDRLRLYGAMACLIIALALILSYFLSQYLQKRISAPVIALAKTAKIVSDQQNFSVRAAKFDDDEMGSLTDSFNQMLDRIQQQTQALIESNARVKSVINSALSAVVVIDKKGMITDWNERAVKIFGWNNEEAIGKDLSAMIIPERYKIAHKQGLASFLLSNHGPVLNNVIEISAIRKGGEEFPVELLVSTLTTGAEISFCGFITDITERKLAEEKIKSFNQQLEQLVEKRTNELQTANSELESFSYSISHDLRAPLRSIHGYITILSEEYGDKLDEEGHRLISIALKSGQRMGQLIDDLLAFSRLGRAELNRTDVSMDDMVAFILDEQRKYNQHHKFEIKLSHLPMARADVSTIRQVWVNLISNAIKYSQHKEKSVIEIGSFEKDQQIVYYVRDNGAGFDMKYYNKLFGVFQRLHSHTEFDGTGVGLAIVQRIIARHNGKIWAEAKVNEGATFFFSLKN
jgi:PAS domain S-box-containing protein